MDHIGDHIKKLIESGNFIDESIEPSLAKRAEESLVTWTNTTLTGTSWLSPYDPGYFISNWTAAGMPLWRSW